MIAYDWSSGRFSQAIAFEPTEEGFRHFERYLKRSPQQPVNLLIDLIEEEFNLETVPHARGKDLRAILDRTLKRYFRTSELCRIAPQGREKFGRKDFKVLASGLANTTILKKWLAIIESARTPVKGVLSLPILGEKLLPAIKQHKNRVLMISQQAPSTLRQSFYDNGHIKMSRLAHHKLTGVDDAALISRDIINTIRYLRSKRLLKRNETVHVCIITPEPDKKTIEHNLSGEELIECFFIPLSQLKSTIGVRGDLPTQFSDGIFAHLACKGFGPSNHYASRPMRHYYRYHLARFSLRTIAFVTLALGIAIGAHNLLKANLLQEHTAKLRTEKNLYLDHYQARIQQFDTFSVPPDVVKSAVGVLSKLESEGERTPFTTLTQLASIMQKHPEIVLMNVHWRTATNPELNALSDSQLARSEIKKQTKPIPVHELTYIVGKVKQTDNSYRQSVEAFGEFIADLRQTSHFKTVNVGKTPFDIDPEAGISGDNSSTSNNALNAESTFTITLLQESGQ